MRLAVVFVLIAILLAACSRGGSSHPTATPTLQLTAAEILRRSDDAMNELTSARVRVQTSHAIAPDLNPPTERTRDYVKVAGGWPNYQRSRGRPVSPTGGSSLTVTLADLHVVRQQLVNETAAWVIGYSFKSPSVEGPFDVFVTEWIAKDTFRLLKREHYNNDPYGSDEHVTEEYLAFNTLPTPTPPTAG